MKLLSCSMIIPPNAHKVNRVTTDSFDFVIFDGRWTLAAAVGSLAFALAVVYTDRLVATCAVEHSGEEVTLLLSSIVGLFVTRLLVIFPVVVLWRMVSHRKAIQSTLRYRVKIIPSWVLWLAAIACTVIAAFWIALAFIWSAAPTR